MVMPKHVHCSYTTPTSQSETEWKLDWAQVASSKLPTCESSTDSKCQMQIISRILDSVQLWLWQRHTHSLARSLAQCKCEWREHTPEQGAWTWPIFRMRLIRWNGCRNFSRWNALVAAVDLYYTLDTQCTVCKAFDYTTCVCAVVLFFCFKFFSLLFCFYCIEENVQ